MNAMMLPERSFNKILLTALLVGAVSTASAGTPCGNNLEWELNGSTLVLSSPNPSLSATIDAQAFINRTDFTDVIIPENVTEINTKAFENCTALTSVVIPPLVNTIGPDAFRGCSNLASVLCRPTTAPSLGTDAFTGCASALQICVYKLGGEGGYKVPGKDWNTSYGEKLTLCFLDERDDQEATEGQITSLRTLNRTFVDVFRTLRKAGSFNTLTLPFNVSDLAESPLAGAEVYTFSSAAVEAGTLVLDIEQVTSNTLTAGTPYLIQWPDDGTVMTRMHFTEITWDSDQTADEAGSDDVKYIGFYGRKHIDDDTNHSNLFLAGNNTLYWPTDGDDPTAKMLGFRAYFHVNTSSPSPAPIYRGIPASLRIKSTPTDINPVTGNPSPVTEKVLRNGQIIIIRNGEKYSINGQKL